MVDEEEASILLYDVWEQVSQEPDYIYGKSDIIIGLNIIRIWWFPEQ